MDSPQLTKNSVPVKPGDILAGKYCVERVLGTGGMGFVVAARIINLGKLVALKMMLPAALSMPRAVERFEREARAAVQLKSEHITEVLDIGRLPTGEPFIVMELLDGDDFEGLLARDQWLQVEDAVDYVLQACEAVAEAHALGVVHRDLKPKNLFLSHRLDGSPLVKVLDFGISKWTTPDSDSHSLTKTTDVFGSPNYMSPEQIRSARDVDGRTDIWSLGVILFELLTGRVPFVAESLPQLCALVLEKPAPPISAVREGMPEGLVAVVARCLEKSMDRRFQSVGELAAALEPFGRPRPKLRSGGALSPSASTLVIPAPRPSGSTPPPPDPSSAGAQVLNRTSTAWEETASAARRGRQRVATAIVLPAALLVMGTVLWFGLRLTRPLAAPPPDAATSTASSATTTTLPLAPASLSAALPAAPASATASAPAPSASAVARPTSVPGTTVRQLPKLDAGPVPTAQLNPPPPPPPPPPLGNPLAPVERK